MKKITILHGPKRDNYHEALNQLKRRLDESYDGFEVHGFTDTFPDDNPHNVSLTQVVAESDFLLVADDCLETSDAYSARMTAIAREVKTLQFTAEYEIIHGQEAAE